MADVKCLIMDTYIIPATAGAIALKMDINVTERPFADALRS
jgi:hypothetical protein